MMIKKERTIMIIMNNFAILHIGMHLCVNVCISYYVIIHIYVEHALAVLINYIISGKVRTSTTRMSSLAGQLQYIK